MERAQRAVVEAHADLVAGVGLHIAFDLVADDGTADRTGNWGNLPPRLRQAMLSGKRSLDDFPPEYQQVLKEYMKKLADEKD